MSMTLSPMTGMGASGMGAGAGPGMSMPMLMQILAAQQGGGSPAPVAPLGAGMVQHTPPMAGPIPGPPPVPPQQPQQGGANQSMSAMMPAIMQMMQHGNGSGPSPAQGLMNFFSGNQTGVVPQGVPGGMPTSAPGTTDTTGGIGGYLSLPGILRALNPNYAGPMPPMGGAF